jgi:hypothetical protein
MQQTNVFQIARKWNPRLRPFIGCGAETLSMVQGFLGYLIVAQLSWNQTKHSHGALPTPFTFPLYAPSPPFFLMG